MATHGVDGGGIAGAGIQMAMGVNMANQMAGAMQPQPGAGVAQSPQPQVLAGRRHRHVREVRYRSSQGKFCRVRHPLAQAKKFCTGCGQELVPGQKFCANCGTSAASPRTQASLVRPRAYGLAGP